MEITDLNLKSYLDFFGKIAINSEVIKDVYISNIVVTYYLAPDLNLSKEIRSANIDEILDTTTNAINQNFSSDSNFYLCVDKLLKESYEFYLSNKNTISKNINNSTYWLDLKIIKVKSYYRKMHSIQYEFNLIVNSILSNKYSNIENINISCIKRLIIHNMNLIVSKKIYTQILNNFDTSQHSYIDKHIIISNVIKDDYIISVDINNSEGLMKIFYTHFNNQIQINYSILPCIQKSYKILHLI